MAEIFCGEINRRDFIKTGIGALGVMVTFGGGTSFGVKEDRNQVARWAFMADTHIPADANSVYRGFYPCRNLPKVIPGIVSARPDGVVIAGDLARMEGKRGDYVNLKKLLEPLAAKMPIFMALGNHDNRVNFHKTFPTTPGEKQAVKNKHVIVVNKPPIRLIILDSLLYVKKVPGLLGKAQRDWLEAYLKNSDETPTILCLHHTLGDADSCLLDVPRLFEMIAPLPKVKAIIYGHSHSYAYSQRQGIHLINLPAVGYNFRKTEPLGWLEAELTAQGGEFKLHAFDGDKTKDGDVTRLKWRV